MKRIRLNVVIAVTALAAAAGACGDTDADPTASEPAATTAAPMATGAGGTGILVTNVAGPVPAIASCPNGSRPDEPGRIDEARPSGDFSYAGGAVDTQSGRLVAAVTVFDLDPMPPREMWTSEMWTMDLCTNTWTRRTPLLNLPQPLGLSTVVYDADSDLVVAFDGTLTIAYDADSDTWTQSSTPSSSDATSKTIHAVYDPVSGLIVTRDLGQRMWAYDVDVDTWTELDQGPTSPPPKLHTQVMVYDRAADRIVLYDGGGDLGLREQSTWVFDPRVGRWSIEDVIIPDGGSPPSSDVGAAAYDEAAGLTLVVHRWGVMAYDATEREWRVVWENDEPVGRHWMTWAAYDPINERILGVHRAIDDDWTEDLWAFDSTTARWLELAPS